MRRIVWALAVGLLLPATLAASVARAEPNALEARFLRAERSLWDTFGMKLSKNGQQVGPTYFALIPDEVVAGSAEARRHVGHARVLHGSVLGLGVASLGLAAGSVAIWSSNDNRWTDGSGWMLTGAVLAMFVGYICAIERQNEMWAAVSAYNHDLVSGRLKD
jgi:hypothetical protein